MLRGFFLLWVYLQIVQMTGDFLLIAWKKPAGVESSRTSLALRTSLRTHFEVLGLGLEGQVLGVGLEASSSQKLTCPRLEDSTIFLIVKILWSAWKIFWKTFFCGDRLKNFCEDLFLLESTCPFVLGPWPWPRAFLSLASSIPVLGLESVCSRKGCPWPRIFFVSLASSLVSSRSVKCVLLWKLKVCSAP